MKYQGLLKKEAFGKKKERSRKEENEKSFSLILQKQRAGEISRRGRLGRARKPTGVLFGDGDRSHASHRIRVKRKGGKTQSHTTKPEEPGKKKRTEQTESDAGKHSKTPSQDGERKNACLKRPSCRLKIDARHLARKRSESLKITLR